MSGTIVDADVMAELLVTLEDAGEGRPCVSLINGTAVVCSVREAMEDSIVSCDGVGCDGLVAHVIVGTVCGCEIRLHGSWHVGLKVKCARREELRVFDSLVR